MARSWSGASSAESGDSNSASKPRADSVRSGRQRPTPTRREFSAVTGPAPPTSVTSDASTGPALSARASSAAGSPVNPSASAGGVRVSWTTGGCGQSSREPFAQFDPDGSLWRTYRGYYLSSMGPPSRQWSWTWPRSGMIQSGIAYRLPRSAPPIGGTGCSSLPTPVVSRRSNRSSSPGASERPSLASMAERQWPTPSTTMNAGYASEEKRMAKSSGGHRAGHRGNELLRRVRMLPTPRAIYGEHPGMRDPHHLTGAVRHWPTPRATDSRAPGMARTVRGGLNLTTAVRWSTPKARDWRSVTGRETRGSPDLNLQVGGQLNPAWVEWLMGFPIGWTECGPWATPSSGRTQQSSVSSSSKRRQKREA